MGGHGQPGGLSLCVCVKQLLISPSVSQGKEAGSPGSVRLSMSGQTPVLRAGPQVQRRVRQLDLGTERQNLFSTPSEPALPPQSASNLGHSRGGPCPPTQTGYPCKPRIGECQHGTGPSMEATLPTCSFGDRKQVKALLLMTRMKAHVSLGKSPNPSLPVSSSVE